MDNHFSLGIIIGGLTITLLRLVMDLVLPRLQARKATAVAQPLPPPTVFCTPSPPQNCPTYPAGLAGDLHAELVARIRAVPEANARKTAELVLRLVGSTTQSQVWPASEFFMLAAAAAREPLLLRAIQDVYAWRSTEMPGGIASR
jgi:hypothetical protein